MSKIETNASYASYANGKVAPQEIQETVQEQDKQEAINPPSIDASAAATEVVESDSKKLKLMSMEEEATTPTGPRTQSLRYNIIKRLIVYFIFIAIFLASIFTRNIAANSTVSETRSNITNL